MKQVRARNTLLNVKHFTIPGARVHHKLAKEFENHIYRQVRVEATRASRTIADAVSRERNTARLHTVSKV